MLLRLTPIVWHITHSLALTLRHFQTELKQLEIISMWLVVPFIDDTEDISQAIEQEYNKVSCHPAPTLSMHVEDAHFMFLTSLKLY